MEGIELYYDGVNIKNYCGSEIKGFGMLPRHLPGGGKG